MYAVQVKLKEQDVVLFAEIVSNDSRVPKDLRVPFKVTEQLVEELWRMGVEELKIHQRKLKDLPPEE